MLNLVLSNLSVAKIIDQRKQPIMISQIILLEMKIKNMKAANLIFIEQMKVCWMPVFSLISFLIKLIKQQMVVEWDELI
jgi:hypothetical protein